jgi:hypothetical protein
VLGEGETTLTTKWTLNDKFPVARKEAFPSNFHTALPTLNGRYVSPKDSGKESGFSHSAVFIILPFSHFAILVIL